LTKYIIKIDTSPIRYFSQLDEASFFARARRIPCITSVNQGFVHVRSKRLSESGLRDLIAIMRRYRMPMAQHRQLLKDRNEYWFNDSNTSWHREVFDA